MMNWNAFGWICQLQATFTWLQAVATTVLVISSMVGWSIASPHTHIGMDTSPFSMSTAQLTHAILLLW